MHSKSIVLALILAPTVLSAQQPVDTLHQHGDSLSRRGPVQVQGITVTAAPIRRDEPVSSVRVTAAAVARTPATNPYDLLRQTAGIEVHDQGQGPGFASDASVRGFSSDHSTDIALWIDGVPNNEPVNGHAEGYNDWSLLFPEAIQEIDVLKGPVSPLYGNFGLAGVVNVRTLDRMRGSQLTLSGGSYGRAEGSFLTGSDGADGGSVLGIRGFREDGWRPNSDNSLGQVHARVVRNLSTLTSIDAGVDLYGARWDSPGFISAAQFDRALYDTTTNVTYGGFKRHATERVSLQVVTPGGAVWRSTVYATQGRWQLFLTIPPEPGSGEGSGGQTEEEDTRHGFGATTALTTTFGRSEVTFGAEGRFDRADYGRWSTTDRVRVIDSVHVPTIVDAQQGSGALFAQSLTDLGHHLRLTAGGRVDVLNTTSWDPAAPDSMGWDTHAIVSPKLGLLYHIPGWADLYTNVSRGFRQTDGVIEDPSLGFITAWAYEAGVKADFKTVNAEVALFRMDVSNEQSFDPITLQPTSGGASRRQGVELGLRARLANALALHGSWTFNDAKYRDAVTPGGDTLSGTRVFNTARYVGEAGLDWAPPAARWHVGLSGNVVGPYTPFNEAGVELPAYGLLHLNGGIRVGGVELNVGVRNLLNRAYPELRAGGFVSPGQPRAIYSTASYRW
ncbi:MAG: TonB-dependent receptor [Gemmatimonadales bacterium]